MVPDGSRWFQAPSVAPPQSTAETSSQDGASGKAVLRMSKMPHGGVRGEQKKWEKQPCRYQGW